MEPAAERLPARAGCGRGLESWGGFWRASLIQIQPTRRASQNNSSRSRLAPAPVSPGNSMAFTRSGTGRRAAMLRQSIHLWLLLANSCVQLKAYLMGALSRVLCLGRITPAYRDRP